MKRHFRTSWPRGHLHELYACANPEGGFRPELETQISNAG